MRDEIRKKVRPVWYLTQKIKIKNYDSFFRKRAS